MRQSPYRRISIRVIRHAPSGASIEEDRRAGASADDLLEEFVGLGAGAGEGKDGVLDGQETAGGFQQYGRRGADGMEFFHGLVQVAADFVHFG